jgi:hypothetical protein
MKRPVESDFQVTRSDGGVNVTFTPTKSYYTFTFLVDPADIARLGPLSPGTVRHAATGDTVPYMEDEVLSMARRLAEKAAS